MEFNVIVLFTKIALHLTVYIVVSSVSLIKEKMKVIQHLFKYSMSNTFIYLSGCISFVVNIYSVTQSQLIYIRYVAETGHRSL